MVTIYGKFGCDEKKKWPVTFGMNSKGGMDEVEFRKYPRGSILPLFQDAKDEKGNRVMIKIDSGPGSCFAILVAELRNIGLYMYPGVPNKMEVTQETGRNYGTFKT